jgi:uncharacterized secreted protein with C-terminal beta-propeller domain
MPNANDQRFTGSELVNRFVQRFKRNAAPFGASRYARRSKSNLAAVKTSSVMEKLEDRQLLTTIDGSFVPFETASPVDTDSAEQQEFTYYVSSDGDTVRLELLQGQDESLSIDFVSASTIGSQVEISEDRRAVLFTPFVGTTGEDGFAYQRSDGVTLAITVDLVSIARPDEFTFAEGSATQTLDVLANDFVPSDYDGPGLITSVSFGSRGGNVQISDDGKSISYDVFDGHGVERFAYVIDESFSALATVNVERMLNPDVLRDSRFYNFSSNFTDYEFGGFDQPIQLSPLENDRFDELGYSGARQITDVAFQFGSASNIGSVEIGSNGQDVFFQPIRGYVGSVQIAYVVDGTFTESISIYVPNLALRDELQVDTNSASVTVRVLQNDYLPDTATIVTVNRPDLVSISDDGRSLVYTAPQDFVGSQSIEYETSTGSSGTMNVSVSNPVRNDSIHVAQDSTDAVLSVLANDFYSDGYEGARLITAVTDPELGTVRIAEDGRSLLYTPQIGFVGTDNVSYVVDSSLTASVTIQVNSRLNADSYSISFLPGQTIELPVLNNDHNLPNDGQITSLSELDPAIGQISISEDSQRIVFVPNTNPSPGVRTQFGRFRYTVDGRYAQDVSIRSTSLAAAIGDSVTVAQNESILIDVLSNDRFTDLVNDYYGLTSDSLEEYQGPQLITSVSESESGAQPVIAADGKSVSYTAPPNYAGRDSFVYTVDGQFTATVFVNVIRYVRDDSFAVLVDSEPKELKVLLNDALTEFSGTKLISDVSATSAGGSVEIADDGRSVLYTPAAEFNGVDTFTYTVGETQIAEARIRVVSSAQDFFVGFENYEDFREWMIEEAFDRYASQFGQPIPNFQNDYFRSVVLSVADFSTTNVQVEGVDEADLVENDGEHLYFISGSDLIIIKANPADELAEVGRYSIDGRPIGMYLHAGRLTIISESSGLDTVLRRSTRNSAVVTGGLTISQDFLPNYSSDPTTIVTVLNVADPAAPEFIKKTTMDGEYVESRSVDGSVNVVVDSGAIVLPGPLRIDSETTSESNDDALFIDPFFWGRYPSQQYESRDDYEARIRADFDTIIGRLLPTIETQGATGVASSDFLSNPADWRRVLDSPTYQLLSVVEFNAGNDANITPDIDSLLSSEADEVYATRDHLYVFGTTYENGFRETLIQQFNWADNGSTELVGVGRIEGELLNQFSIDETEGQLRLAMSVSRVTESGRRNATDIVILENSSGLFQATSSLLDVARGESAKAVRFAGDLAFVSTFGNSSPLNVIDLSHPDCPTFVGQIRTSGQVGYMQLIDPTHLVVLGSNTIGGSPGPLTLSVYDVSDPANPDLLDRDILAAYSSSIALDDHHAFQWFARHQTLALPYSSSSTRPSYYWGLGSRPAEQFELKTFRIDVSLGEDESTITTTGSLAQPGEVLRSAFIGDTLYSLGNGQIQSTDINAPNEDVQTLDLEFNSTSFLPTIFFAADHPDWIYASGRVVPSLTQADLLESVAVVVDGTLTVDATEFIAPHVEGTVDEINNQIVIEIYKGNADGTRSSTPFFTRSFDADQINDVHVTLGDASDKGFVTNEFVEGGRVDLSQLNVPTHIEGGAGDDVLVGGRQADLIEGGAGNDVLLGAAGKDELRGGAGNDYLKGQGGGDLLDGGTGIDKLYGGAGRNDFRDTVGGELVATNNGYESDRGDFADSRRPMRSVHLTGGILDDIFDLSKLSGIDVSVLGGAGNDIIIGSQGNDYIVGGDGDDILLGAAGDDFMLGGAGRDQIKGHSGHDHIQGGQGSDRLDGGKGSNKLVRERFAAGENDPLDMEEDTIIGEFTEVELQASDETLSAAILMALDATNAG